MSNIGESSVVIPESIVSEILLRLPVKPLFRFKCVSKSWNHLISEPSFTKDRKKLASETHNLDNLIVKHPAKIELYSDRELNETNFNDYTISTNDFHFIGSCNGVVCFSTLPTNRSNSGGFDLILWNPTTNKTFKLPKHRGPYRSDQLRFCRNSDEFNIVSVEDTAVHVYNFFGNSWTHKGHTFPASISSGAAAEQAVVDGSPHWCCEDVDGEGVILAFDPITDQFNKIAMPEVGQSKSRAANLGGCLAVIVEKGDEGLEVWVMKEYGVAESWRKELVVQRGLGCHFKCIWNERLVFVREREGVGSEVAWYDPKTKSFNTIFVSGSVEMEVFSYEESAVSVQSPAPAPTRTPDRDSASEIPGTDWYISGLTSMGVYY